MSRGSNAILELKNVTKKFKTSDDKVLTACSDISINFYKGETLGIVGESGCGKTTLMKMIMQLEKPTDGEIIYRGENITKLKGEKQRLNRKNIQMVFQDSSTSFNPRMKIRDIICEPLINFNLIRRSQKDEVAKKYLDMVDLPEDFLYRYPHNMSGGQRQRVGIARALTLNPEIIIFDEATSALDVSIQKSIIELISKLQKKNNITIGFVCHDIALVSQFCHQVVVMYLGNIVEIIPGEILQNHCIHPYTKKLISSVFDIHMDYSKKIKCTDEEITNSINRPMGCPFENRCKFSLSICKEERPELRKISKNHYVACHLNKGAENEEL